MKKETNNERKDLRHGDVSWRDVVVVLLAAGAAVGLWGYSSANSNVHNQLAEQQITFPPLAAFAAKAGTEITPGMIPYLREVRRPASCDRPAG